MDEEATGVAAVGWDPVSFWHQRSLLDLLPLPARGHNAFLYRSSTRSGDNPGRAGLAAGQDDNRKIVRTASLELEVKHASLAVEQIHALADRLGGFLVSSQIEGGSDARSAAVNIRVPTARFEEALVEIKKLGDRLESEKIETADVTQNYVDRDAKLRNLRAEESQYLLILKHAATVRDTLEVTGKLSEVRGQIEQQQAEFLVLAKQIETVAISVSLVPVAEAQVFGMHWRPWYTIKLAAHDGMDSVAAVAGSITAGIFLLPAVILWLATIIACAAITVRILRWVWRRFFTFGKPPATLPAAGRDSIR